MYAPKDQTISAKMTRDDVPNESLILVVEAERNTDPLSRSPLWKNEGSTLGDVDRLSTMK